MEEMPPVFGFSRERARLKSDIKGFTPSLHDLSVDTHCPPSLTSLCPWIEAKEDFGP